MNAPAKIEAHESNIYSALAAAQLEFGSVQKGSVNPAFKSKYADLADVASVVIPALARHGVAVLHYPVRHPEGLDMRTEFVHGETGSKVWCDIPLIVDRQNMQGMKSATTYAKRIGLESLSGVAPEDDDGNAAAAAAPPPQERKKQGPSAEAIEAATGSLDAAETLDALKAIWMDLPKPIQAVPAVIKAKDAAKARIEAAAQPERQPGEDLDDEIPYQ